MKEIWRDIKDYEGLYQVSNFGRVRSLDRNGKGKGNGSKGKILKLCLDKSNGYYIVMLYKNGISKKYSVHRLVAEAFIPNPDNLPTVDHINRIRTDNRIENLRWADYRLQRENCDKEPNKIALKESCSKPVLQYTKGGQFIKEYPSITEAGRNTGINYSSICQCCLGKRKSAGGYIWKYV